jgi:hypothetical protein
VFLHGPKHRFIPGDTEGIQRVLKEREEQLAASFHPARQYEQFNFNNDVTPEKKNGEGS